MERCWLCDEKYPNLTSLHKHLASRVHTRLRVVCPWCMGQEKTFTRIADLKVHCAALHPESLEMSPRFFSSANAFYISRHPDDYRRIINIGAFDSEEAIHARKLIEKWCRTLSSAHTKILHWKAGWMGAMEECCSKKKRTYQESSCASDIGEDPDVEIGEEINPKGRKISIGNSGSKANEKGDHKDTSKDREERCLVSMCTSDSRLVRHSQPNKKEKEKEKQMSGKETEEKEKEKQTSESITENTNARNDRSQRDELEKDLFGETTDDEDDEDSRDTDIGEETQENLLKQKEERLKQQISDIQTKLKEKEREKKELNKHQDKEEIKVRAEQILKVGAMPLCPPGRRDWKEEGVLSVEVGNKTYEWPPRNFKDMSPDEKLLSWEYMAMTIEHEASGKFPSLSRQLLLDTYNFLALPGTRKAYDCRDKAYRKVRFYNYQLVRQIAQGTLTSQEGQDLLASLETIRTAQKETMATKIAAKLDSINVKLRLDSD